MNNPRLLLRTGQSLLFGVLFFSLCAAPAFGATLFEQTNISVLGETVAEHPGSLPVQRLGKGLSGSLGSVVYKMNGTELASTTSGTSVIDGYGAMQLFRCGSTDSGYSGSCVAATSPTLLMPTILSQSGNDAFILVDFTSAAYTFDPNLYYYFKWLITGDMALYGSSGDTYAPGAGLWLGGGPVLDANTADIGFRVCDTASCDLTPDTQAPIVSLDSGPADGSYASSTLISYSFTATDEHLAAVTCAWDGAATSTCSSPASATLAEGAHTFTLVAADSAGNTTTATRSVIVDTVVPVLAEAAAIAASTDTTPEYSFTSSEAGSLAFTGSCSAAVSSVAAGTTTVTFGELSPGSYNCSLSVTDAAGNTGTLTLSAFTVEETPPPAPAPSSGGGGVIGGPLSVGYQTPTPAPAPAPTPSPQPVLVPAPEPEVAGAMTEVDAEPARPGNTPAPVILAQNDVPAAATSTGESEPAAETPGEPLIIPRIATGTSDPSSPLPLVATGIAIVLLAGALGYYFLRRQP